MARVALRFADGETAALDTRPGETLLAAARRSGIPLAADCESGECQTCRATLEQGAVRYPDGVELALTPADVAGGAALCCLAEPAADELTLALPYARAALLPVKTAYLSVQAVTPVCASAVALRGTLMRNATLAFYPGQYVNLTVPGADRQRAYSMASPPEQPGQLEFLVRLIAGGAMSEFLRAAPKPGTVIPLKGPYGVFYLRERDAPALMVAGGTGLAPMLSILRHLARRGVRRRLTLCFGVTRRADLFGLDQLDQLATQLPGLERRVALMLPDEGWSGGRGLVTDLLRPADLADGPDVYLCGPPAMIETAQEWLRAQGHPADRVFTEQFVASGD